MLPIGSVVGGLTLLVLYTVFTLYAPIFVARRLLPRPSHPVARRLPVLRGYVAFLNALRCHPAVFGDPAVGFATRSIAADAMACTVGPSYANGPMSISFNRRQLSPRHPNNMRQQLLTTR